MRWIYAVLLSTTSALADPMVIEDFTDERADGWQYVSDRVMGGVSNGRAQFVRENDEAFVRLSGEVSTANNGGFIQVRKTLLEGLPASTTALRLRVRGNGAGYYIHLRPQEARRPWQYFQARFETTGAWQDITLPLSAFAPEGGLRGELQPQDIIGLGIVAYGADYTARLDVARVEVIAQD